MSSGIHAAQKAGKSLQQVESPVPWPMPPRLNSNGKRDFPVAESAAPSANTNSSLDTSAETENPHNNTLVSNSEFITLSDDLGSQEQFASSEYLSAVTEIETMKLSSSEGFRDRSGMPGDATRVPKPDVLHAVQYTQNPEVSIASPTTDGNKRYKEKKVEDKCTYKEREKPVLVEYEGNKVSYEIFERVARLYPLSPRSPRRENFSLAPMLDDSSEPLNDYNGIYERYTSPKVCKECARGIGEPTEQRSISPAHREVFNRTCQKVKRGIAGICQDDLDGDYFSPTGNAKPGLNFRRFPCATDAVHNPLSRSVSPHFLQRIEFKPNNNASSEENQPQALRRPIGSKRASIVCLTNSQDEVTASVQPIPHDPTFFSSRDVTRRCSADALERKPSGMRAERGVFERQESGVERIKTLAEAGRVDGFEPKSYHHNEDDLSTDDSPKESPQSSSSTTHNLRDKSPHVDVACRHSSAAASATSSEAGAQYRRQKRKGRWGQVRRAGPEVPEAARTEFSIAYSLSYAMSIVEEICVRDLDKAVYRRLGKNKFRIENKPKDKWSPTLMVAIEFTATSDCMTHVSVRASRCDKGKTKYVDLWTFYDDLVTQLEIQAYSKQAQLENVFQVAGT